MAQPMLLGGKYTVGKLVGKGASGKVFQALDLDGKIWALKVIPQRNVSEEIENEIVLLKKISGAGTDSRECHPFITCIKEVFELDSPRATVLVLDFFEGYDLSKIVPTITLDQTFVVGKKLIEAISFLHTAGICHRDLKLENVMFNETGMKLSVIDFGLGCERDGRGQVRGCRLSGVGTPPYIPPERSYPIWDEEKYPYSFVDCTPGDVYAYGVMLYELLTNETFNPPVNGPYFSDQESQIRVAVMRNLNYSSADFPDPPNVRLAENKKIRGSTFFQKVVFESTRGDYKKRASAREIFAMFP